jgi:hypothetical protein
LSWRLPDMISSPMMIKPNEGVMFNAFLKKIRECGADRRP